MLAGVPRTLRFLSTLLGALTLICNVLDKAAPIVRNYVPSEKLTDYDNAVSLIRQGCDVIRAINFVGDNIG